MTELVLNTAIGGQGNHRALKSGAIAPVGFQLEFADFPNIIAAFRRMVRCLEFDVSEMACTTYLCAKAHGIPFTALPLFVARGLHHGAILHNTKLGIRHPKDLEGRRVGLSRGYTVTTGVWARAILESEYGVDLSRITWVRSGDEHVAEYEAPPNVVPAGPGEDLAKMVVAGDLAAVIGVDVDHPDIAPLIRNPADAAITALRRHGLHPINHLVVVRDSLLEQHPDLARSLFEAFAAAKVGYLDRLNAGTMDAPIPADLVNLRVLAATGRDPLPYGIAPNRQMIDELIRHAVSQRILDRPIAVETLFAQGTLDLVA